MSSLTTFRFRYEPDDEFPRFKRLEWEQVGVSIRDVLLNGVHPWMTSSEGGDVHPSLIEAFLQRLNDPAARIQELEPHGYAHDVCGQQSSYYDRQTRFERTLDVVQSAVYFVEDLPYLELLDIAKHRLREEWDHRTARTLAERAHSGFQGLRRFLKAKDSSLRLSGYSDIENYDLGEVLSLDDFYGREGLLIREAIPSLNFRNTAWLANATDSQGRLRLTPSIDRLSLTLIPQASEYVHLVWHVERDGDLWRFRPDVGTSDSKRYKARQFAERWRVDEGRLCFNTNLQRVVEMVETGTVVPSFPALNYTYDSRGPTAAAELPKDRVDTYFIGAFFGRKSNAETLKDILREYGVSMTGTKDQLVRKIAKLAAKQYAVRKVEMERFFRRYRFVHINAIPRNSSKFPLLDDTPLLRNLLMTMYAVKHLRGNAILDVAHENKTYTEEQLALALLNDKTDLSGAFLRVN